MGVKKIVVKTKKIIFAGVTEIAFDQNFKDMNEPKLNKFNTKKSDFEKNN